MNPKYGNTGGEVFAGYCPYCLIDRILAYYEFIKRLYIGTPLHRCGTWELISLITFLKKDAASDIPIPALVNDDASSTYTGLTEKRHLKEFHSEHWIEIDDETEDFDFPCEYMERIFRTVGWVGTALEKFEQSSA
jgi:hypothetical protein